MEDAGFIYDNSMTTNSRVNEAPHWPMTLDFKLPWACQNYKCPVKAHPGLWEVPINQYFHEKKRDKKSSDSLSSDDDYLRSSMISGALMGSDQNISYDVSGSFHGI